MGLTLAERRAITETAASRYPLASKRGKGRILDDLCANTGWHRNHARKALKAALQPKIVTARSARPVKYGPDVIAALTVCWTVLGMPAGKRLAPMLGELVAVLRHVGELVIEPTPPHCWCRCRQPPSIAAWRVSEPNTSSGDVLARSPDRCSRIRFRCIPGPSGTTLCPGSLRSTWSGTTAATGPAAMRSR